jgi:murein DD-endopeptidase MepM/ murein hydrolase activator NlpD
MVLAQAPGAQAAGAMQQYRNEQYGFAFFYPADLRYTEWKPTEDLLASLTFYKAGEKRRPGGNEIDVSLFKSAPGTSLEEWVNERSNPDFAHLPSSLKDSAAVFENAGGAVPFEVGGAEAELFPQRAGALTAHRLVVKHGGSFISITYVDSGDEGLKDAFAMMAGSLKTGREIKALTVDEAIRRRITDSVTASPATAAATIPEEQVGSASLLGYKLPWNPGVSHTVTEGWNTGSHAGTQMYYAYDFDLAVKEKVLASRAGTVTAVQGSFTECGGYDYRNMGNYVTVAHDDGTATLYLHLKRANVTKGQSVDQGTVLGLSGNTGWTDCFPHLHFQRQDQGYWIENSQAVYFDEYPGVQLKKGSSYISQNVVISATISGNTGAPNVRLTAEPLSLTTQSDADGNYQLGVPANWSGTVTPTKAGCTFTPTDITYTDVTADVADQNFSASCRLIYRSVGKYDGWVLESSENGSVGATLNATGSKLKLGDDVQNRQYAAILSFDTSKIPDAAVITDAKLRFRKAGVAGSNPFDTLGNILADMKQGAFLDNAALEAGDFEAPADHAAALTFVNTPVKGWYEQPLSTDDLAFIDQTATTQFRLRFEIDDNGNLIADYLKLHSGSAPFPYRPRLVVSFTTP